MSRSTLNAILGPPKPAVLLFCILLAFAFAGFELPGASHDKKDQPVSMQGLDSYDLQFYSFDLQVTNASREISGLAEIHAECIDASMDTLYLQLSNSMTVDSVRINDVMSVFLHADQVLKIPVNIFQGEIFRAGIYYHGEPAGTFYKGVHRAYAADFDRWVTWTFSQPFYAYKWFPCKQIHSDKIDSVYMSLRTDSSLTAVSSGTLHAKTSLDGGMVKYEWRTKYAINYDMIFFAVSDYIPYGYYTFPEGGSDSVLISHYVYSQDYIDAMQGRLDSFGLFVDYFSEIYGLYPFADESFGIVTVPGVPCMSENNVLVVMIDELDFLSTHTFIDGNCHELTHQWFGDYVACSTYTDIWLSEGFGMYGGYLGEAKFGNTGQAEEWMEGVRMQAFSNDCGSVFVPENMLENPSRIFNWQLTYCKGAMLVHMIRYELDNDSIFFSVLKNYIDQYGNRTACLDDFKSVLESTSGKDFSTFFNQWYYGEGYPLLDITWEYDEGVLQINAVQSASCEITPLFVFWMDYKLVFEDGDTVVRCLHDDFTVQHIFDVGKQVIDVIPDPAQWILVETDISYVGIPVIKQEDVFRVFPNPSSGILNLSFETPVAGKIKLELYDAAGKYIKCLYAGDYARNTALSVASVPDGLYFVRLTTESSHFTRKLIVRKP